MGVNPSSLFWTFQMTADVVVGTLCQEMGSQRTSAIRGNRTPSFPLVVNNQLLQSLALANNW